MPKKLLIDLLGWDEAKEAGTRCSYTWHLDSGNNGVAALRELATFALVCRQCEEADCVKSCPEEALEKQPDGVLKRYNMRCVSCKTCSHACPFGTILPELVPFAASRCDYCLDRLSSGRPACAETSGGGVQYKEVSEDTEKDLHAVGEHLVVRCKPWIRDEKEASEKR